MCFLLPNFLSRIHELQLTISVYSFGQICIDLVLQHQHLSNLTVDDDEYPHFCMLRISMRVLLIVDSMEGGFISEPYWIDQLHLVVGFIQGICRCSKTHPILFKGFKEVLALRIACFPNPHRFFSNLNCFWATLQSLESSAYPTFVGSGIPKWAVSTPISWFSWILSLNPRSNSSRRVLDYMKLWGIQFCKSSGSISQP